MNALRQGNVGVHAHVDLFLDAGTQSFWDGGESVTISTRTYVPIGGFGAASATSMSRGLGADGIQLTLDATRLLSAANDLTDPAYWLSQIIADGGYRQRRMEMFYSFWDHDSAALLFTRRVFTGVIDQMNSQQTPAQDGGGGLAILVVNCENLALRFGQRVGRVRSHEDQQEIWPGDDGFKFVASTIAKEREIYWGRNGSTASSPGFSPRTSPRDPYDIDPGTRYR